VFRGEADRLPVAFGEPIDQHATVRSSPLLILLLLASNVSCGTTGSRERESTNTAMTTLLTEHAEWTRTRNAELRLPEGWLSLVALVWLEPGETTLGSVGTPAPDRIVLQHAEAAEAGRFTLHRGTQVHFTPAEDGLCRLDDVPIQAGESVILSDDRLGTPAVLRVGGLHITHVHRQERSALRIRDRDATTLQEFAGVQRYAFDPDRRVDATFEPAEDGTTIDVTLVTEFVEPHQVAGTLRFKIDGVEHTLLAHPSGQGLFVAFADTTSGITSYGGGRFLVVEPSDEDGHTWIDFNRAFNPPCSFTAFATCPLPPPGNRLPIAMNAGEKHGTPH
jgi:uncharacterized protein (DUF1684 family)